MIGLGNPSRLSITDGSNEMNRRINYFPIFSALSLLNFWIYPTAALMTCILTHCKSSLTHSLSLSLKHATDEVHVEKPVFLETTRQHQRHGLRHVLERARRHRPPAGRHARLPGGQCLWRPAASSRDNSVAAGRVKQEPRVSRCRYNPDPAFGPHRLAIALSAVGPQIVMPRPVGSQQGSSFILDLANQSTAVLSVPAAEATVLIKVCS